MPDLFDGWPFWLVFVALFAGAMLRGQGLYWLARLVTGEAVRRGEASGRPGRAARWLAGKDVALGVETLRRWGLVAVPVCYLTVGFQSLVLLAAGVLRMSAWAFTLAQLPGALAWATIYSTIGWAVWEASLIALAGNPWALAGLAAVIVVAVATYVVRRG